MLAGLYRYRLGNVGRAVSIEVRLLYRYRHCDVGWAVIIYAR